MRSKLQRSWQNLVELVGRGSVEVKCLSWDLKTDCVTFKNCVMKAVISTAVVRVVVCLVDCVFSVMRCVFSVMRGIGEMDVNQRPPPQSRVEPLDNSCPYLLLDIRDRDEYDACHIINGKYHWYILWAAFDLCRQFVMATGIWASAWRVWHPLPRESRGGLRKDDASE